MTMRGDNSRIMLVSSTMDDFERGISIMMGGGYASYYAITKRWGLVLFWFVDKQEGMRTEHTHWLWDEKAGQSGMYTETYQIVKFVEDEKMTAGPCIEFVLKWLLEERPEDYEEPMEHFDGSTSKGFTISSGDGWFGGHVGDHRGAFGYIKPTLIYHGK